LKQNRLFLLEIPRCYQQFFRYRYFAGIRFIWRSVFPVGITNLAGTPFFRKRGAGCIKKGASAPFFLKKGAFAPFLREIGFPTKKIIPKCTDRDFLRYRYGKYREIPTDTDRKIPIRYTTLVFTGLFSDRTLTDCTLFWMVSWRCDIQPQDVWSVFACGPKNVCSWSKKRHRPHAKIEFCVQSMRRIFYVGIVL
jgi:hypothetical protein